MVVLTGAVAEDFYTSWAVSPAKNRSKAESVGNDQKITGETGAKQGQMGLNVGRDTSLKRQIIKASGGNNESYHFQGWRDDLSALVFLNKVYRQELL